MFFVVVNILYFFRTMYGDESTKSTLDALFSQNGAVIVEFLIQGLKVN